MTSYILGELSIIENRQCSSTPTSSSHSTTVQFQHERHPHKICIRSPDQTIGVSYIFVEQRTSTLSTTSFGPSTAVTVRRDFLSGL
jgi:hypothetical protein